MNEFRRPGLLGPVGAAPRDMRGSAPSFPPTGVDRTAGQHPHMAARLVEQAPKRPHVPAANDDPPRDAPRQLQNAWDSPEALQLVIDEWEANYSEQDFVQKIIEALDPLEAIEWVMKLMRVSRERAAFLIKARRIASWVWKGIAIQAGIDLLNWGADGEKAQISWWLPIAKARRGLLLARRSRGRL